MLPVMALKKFRDAHMIVVTLYIVIPARRSRGEAHGIATLAVGSSDELQNKGAGDSPLKGTGGTDVIQFLKSVRDQTKETLM